MDPDLLRANITRERETDVHFDYTRRRVKLIFHKALQLYKNWFLSDDALKLEADISGRSLLNEVVLPLSKAVAVSDTSPDYEDEWIKELDAVCPPTIDPPRS